MLRREVTSLVVSRGFGRRRTRLLEVGAASLAFGLGACSAQHISGTPDAGISAPPEGVNVSATAPVCPPGAVGALVALNERRLVFHHTDAPCQTPPVRLLIANEGSVTVVVDQIEIGPEPLGVASVELPWRIPPGDHEAIDLSFKTDMPITREGALVFRGEGGCSRIPLHGIATAGDLVSASAYELDFGEVPAGEQSKPQTISYLYQGADSDPDRPSTIGPEASSTPEGLFEAVARMGGQGKVSQCEERSISVVFNAPELPGKYEGVVVFEVLSDVMGAPASGLMVAPVYGTASNGE